MFSDNNIGALLNPKYTIIDPLKLLYKEINTFVNPIIWKLATEKVGPAINYV